MKITIDIKRCFFTKFDVLIFLGALFLSCTTTDAVQKNSDAAATPKSSIDQATQQTKSDEESLPAGCPSKPGICMALHAPATCMAESYNGKDLATSDILSADGGNACKARQALAAAACVRKLDPSKLSKIKCNLKKQ